MLRCLNPDENTEIRHFLRDTGYNTQALKARFGQTEIPHVHLLKLYLVGITLDPNPLNILFRWFWIGSPVETAVAHQFIPARLIELFLKSGMVSAENGNLISHYRISPFNEFPILSDHAVSGAGPLHTNTILWPNPTTRLCADLSIRTPVGRTLDLGTGNGCLALAASTHSHTVIATDLNPRAKEFCEFNAALNGITNIEYREGSAFEPVRGERFDLILANPPFFVTPSVRRVFSDNSMELDGFCRMLIQQAPEHLNEGGYCQMLIEWVQMKGQTWQDRMTEWFKDLGCDAWVMVGYARPSMDYALIRVQEDRDEVTTAAAQAALTNTWREYFESRNVEAIFGGMIVLRKREGQNWVRMEELASMPERPFGEFIRRIFDSRDYMASHSDEELLQTRPALPPAVRLRRQFAISPEGWKVTSIDLQPGEGLPYSMALQPQVADFVALCDGKRTLEEISVQTAAAAGVDPSVVRPESCKIIRRVADRGMILL